MLYTLYKEILSFILFFPLLPLSNLPMGGMKTGWIPKSKVDILSFLVKFNMRGKTLWKSRWGKNSRIQYHFLLSEYLSRSSEVEPNVLFNRNSFDVYTFICKSWYSFVLQTYMNKIIGGPHEVHVTYLYALSES